MSSLFKGEYYQLKKYESNQVQIYNDAADAGIIATDSVRNTMREIIESFSMMDEFSIPYRSETNQITQRQYKGKIYFYNDIGFDYDILYVNDRRNKKEYFSIQIKDFNNER